MSAGRQFEIVYLLLERGRVTAAELAERFEVSVRTIYRDIDALSAAGVPVYAARGQGGGICLMEHYVLERAAFTEEEQSRLLTALQSLPDAARAEAADMLVKLSALFRRQEADWLQVDLSRWGNTAPDEARFEQLKGAILSRQVLAFTYVSSYGTTSRREVCPARLVFKGRSWYLQAFCLERQEWRTFKTSRMLELTPSERTFAPLPSPPPLEGEGMPEPFCVPVVLRFAPWMAYRVYDEFDEGCVIREEDGALRVQVCFPEDQWLYGYLLSFGAAVEVVSPDSLRRNLAALAREIWLSHLKYDAGCQVQGGKMGSSQKEVEPMEFKDMKFCQSCGMPLSSEAACGTEQDGSKSEHYCSYCYQNGAFTSSMTMEEMIEFCVPHMVEGNPGMTAQQAREQMYQFFPLLLRWKKEKE